ncbi:hypothetical protein HRF87_09355, partial [Bacillus sp. CRN 9]|nr:hypothetical protein [Bacillus sp. CRN 9]
QPAYATPNGAPIQSTTLGEAAGGVKKQIVSMAGKVKDGVGKGAGNLTKDVDKIDYGAYLKKNIGDPPKDMYDPHAHHIVFKKGNGKTQKELVKEGQELYSKKTNRTWFKYKYVRWCIWWWSIKRSCLWRAC